MKIALIDPSLFTWPYDSELAHGLKRVGHEVRLYGRRVGPREAGAGDPLLVPHFYRLLGGPTNRLPKAAVRVLKGLGHTSGLMRLVADLKAWQPDVIHFQWAPLPVLDRMFLPALRRIAPVVLTVHDSNPFNGNPGAALQRVGAHAILGEVDRLIVHTAQAAGRLAQAGLPRERIACIPHGLLHADAEAEAEDLPEDDIVTLLQFGQIKPYKGVDVLIRALSLLPPEVRRRTRVKVAGKPYMDMAPLTALADQLGVRGQIEFTLGFVPDKGMMDLFREASAVVFPYREIDTSGVLMVALATGRPVIASAIGGFAELLEDGRHGHLVPPDDPAALAAALESFITQPERRRAMANAVRGLTAAIPSWTEIARRTEALYRSLHREESPCLDTPLNPASASSSRTSTTSAM